MNIAILTIGDELLNGDLPDTNTATIAQVLGTHSFSVREAVSVTDREDDIVLALRQLAERFEVIIVTGGLGPTSDDLTASAAAKAFATPLVLHDKALRQIRARFRLLKRTMHPANQKQALLPKTCTVIANGNGTAPGFHMRHQETDIYFLPGVPREMEPMLEDYILPDLLRRCPDRPRMVQKTITVFGLPEPEVEARLRRASLATDIIIGFNVSLPLVQIKLRLRGDQAQARIEHAEQAVREILGNDIVGTDKETLAETTAKHLIVSGLTVSLAESCTGGLIAKLLTDQPGSSAFLERGVISYANTAKIECLQVDGTILEQFGAVSAECAMAMAQGVRTSARTDIGLAVTGIAGPEGGSDDKPVGTVFLALATAKHQRVEQFHFFGDRSEVRLRTACTALDWLRRMALKKPLDSVQDKP